MVSLQSVLLEVALRTLTLACPEDWWYFRQHAFALCMQRFAESISARWDKRKGGKTELFTNLILGEFGNAAVGLQPYVKLLGEFH